MLFIFKSTFFRTYALAYVTLFVFLLNFHANGQTPEGNGIHKIVIDPGHGGGDPGTLGSKTREKDIALSIALKLGNLIKNNYQDVEVIFTRKDDKFVALDERTTIANASKADLFISIHCNSNPNKSPYGTETYVLGLHKSEDNLDVAMRENAVITYEKDYSSKYEGYDPKSTESYIIFTLMQNAHLDQSLRFANLVETEFREHTSRHDRGVKQAGFLVLWKSSMPSVLIETGFLSNIKEEAFLATESGQESIAASIFKAFGDYKRSIDNQSLISANLQFTKEKDTANLRLKKQNTDVDYEKADIVFKVQITSSRKKIPVTSKIFKNIKGVDEIDYDGIYKYTLGSKKKYAEIVEFCQQIRKQFPDAFIIAVKGNKIIPLDIALKEISI
ncbi:MAG: N-acetylmuramoyl-L-alanine amidase [Bacteroidales bacterium]|nr:N-acetylmuramoyl-L-alanine amidase [Bacteroidales bacterium]